MSGGVAAALGEVLDGQADGEILEQAGLFDHETGSLDAPSPLSGAIPTAKRKGGGRTPGSRNRRTEAVVSWLLSQHRHPLSVMMEAYSMAPADLAERIGLRRAMVKEGDGDDAREVESDRFSNDVLMEVLKLQVRMAEACAPYVAQRMPQAVQVSGAAGLTVSFGGVSLPARGVGSDVGEVIEGEALSINLPFKSDG